MWPTFIPPLGTDLTMINQSEACFPAFPLFSVKKETPPKAVVHRGNLICPLALLPSLWWFKERSHAQFSSSNKTKQTKAWFSTFQPSCLWNTVVVPSSSLDPGGGCCRLPPFASLTCVHNWDSHGALPLLLLAGFHFCLRLLMVTN